MGVRVVTQELSEEDMRTLIGFNNKYGYMLFRENEFKDEEIPAGDSRDDRKTQAQRLRGVLWYVFQATGKPKSEWNNWYDTEMEKIRQHYKDKYLD